MKLLLIVCAIAASLAGCASAPAGYRYHNDGYDYDRGTSRSYGDNHAPGVRYA
jgi:hypothetical protein